MSDVPEGYKMSEVGVIPEEWEVNELGDAAEVVMGQSPVGTSYNRSGIGAPLINGPTEFTEKYPIKIQWTSQPTKFCKKGDVLLCVRGSSTGRINISNDEYCIGRGVAAIRAKSCADTSFITFQVDSAVKSILALTTGSTFPNIDGKSIRAIQFPLPPLPEQQAIASALSDVDALITALEQLITKKRNIKQGAMQQLLTGKKRLPGFGGGWDVKKLEEIEKVIDGDRGKNYPNDNDFSNDGYCLFLSAKNVTKEGFKFSECIFINEEKDSLLSKGKLTKNDLVLTTRGTVGNIALFDDTILFDNIRINSGMVILRNENNLIDTNYLYEILKSQALKNQIDRIVFGSAQPQLTVKGINKFQIPIPPTIEEQQAIAQILRDMDTEIEALKQKRNKYKTIKQGMMQELLTGKTRLV